MTKPNDGGPAFPVPLLVLTDQERPSERLRNEFEKLTGNGMTLRDYFAAKVMAAFIGSELQYKAALQAAANDNMETSVHLAVCSLDVGRQEFGLEIDQLLVRLDRAGSNLEAVQIGHVTVLVDVAGLPDILAIGVDEGDVDPNLGLRAE